MEHTRVFRITRADLDEFCEHPRYEELLASYEPWWQHADQLDPLIHRIEVAFADQRLGDGIGLLEANGIDNYAAAGERAELRARDERDDWHRIDSVTLNECYASPSYFDARGFVFHLPAFLIAELNDEFDNEFIDHLVREDYLDRNWIELLTHEQRDMIAATLKLVAHHPVYQERAAEIEHAIERYST